MEFLIVIAIVGLIIYSFYVFYNGKKEDAQEKSNDEQNLIYKFKKYPV